MFNKNEESCEKGVDAPERFCQIRCAYGKHSNKMRTKTLVLTAFIGALGIAGASAQVYSVNAVGYVNKSIPAGFSIVANPLHNGENKVADVFGANPGALTVYRFGDAGFSINTYDTDFEEWDNGADVVNPGEGFFVLNSGDATTVTFVGEVPQGDLSNALPAGFSIRSSQVPQAGKLSGDLGFPTDEGLTVYQFSNGAYVIDNYDADFEEWDSGAGPTVGVAEGFWVLRSSAAAWTRSFSTSE
ncbi:uncharacterized protein METZ01_LOCUS250608 [marine metagenome]|jgi:hypothetical protein|uniref:Uncharacterized protein n=1 Tax=marine metagenome TaxID=408172 RepID=A0A382IDG8_9ZZZZ|tara:strand:- start:1157 stop:1885 length:729 start_codon:yes stop_codon:yes gene_type:complete